MGLLQRVIEAHGIATVSISQVRSITERIRPPRAIFLAWPFGNALGEPHNVLQQRRVLWEMFRDLRERSETERGSIRDLALAWRRERYAPVDFHGLDAALGRAS